MALLDTLVVALEDGEEHTGYLNTLNQCIGNIILQKRFIILEVQNIVKAITKAEAESNAIARYNGRIFRADKPFFEADSATFVSGTGHQGSPE